MKIVAEPVLPDYSPELGWLGIIRFNVHQRFPMPTPFSEQEALVRGVQSGAMWRKPPVCYAWLGPCITAISPNRHTILQYTVYRVDFCASPLPHGFCESSSQVKLGAFWTHPEVVVINPQSKNAGRIQLFHTATRTSVVVVVAAVAVAATFAALAWCGRQWNLEKSKFWQVLRTKTNSCLWRPERHLVTQDDCR